jgi:hypothetical protein
MADSKKISYNQIADPNLFEPLIKELTEINKLLGVTEDNLKKVLSTSADLAKTTPLGSLADMEKKEKAISDATKAIKELDAVEKDKVKLEQKLKDLGDARVKANFELREEIRLQTKELRDNAKLTSAVGDAYAKLKNDTNKAQLEFKKLAAEFGANSKEAKAARKEFDRFDDQLREVNDAARDGRRDVGRYEKGVAGLTKTFKAFASATIILQALELLKGSISSNSDGAAELEKVWIRVTTVFTVVAARIVNVFPIIQAKFERLVLSFKIGAAELTDLFGSNAEEVEALRKQYDALASLADQDVAASFRGLGAEIEDLTAKKVKLVDDTLAYRREIVGLEQDIADLIPTQEKLRAQFEDDSSSLEEQVRAGVAFRIELQKRQALEETIAARRLKLAQDNAATSRGSVEAQEELSAATVEYSQLIADQAAELVNTEKEIQKLRDDTTQLNLDFYIDDFDNKKTVNERIIADDTQTFARRQELLRQNLEGAETIFDLEEEALNRSLRERGKAQLDFDKLRNESSSEEIARVVRESGISEPLAIRALEVLRERRTFLQDNAEAQRDLNTAEAESAILQDDILLQQRALLALQEKGVDMEKVFATLSKERLQNEVDNLREQIAVAQEGSQARIALNKELNDRLLEQDQARIAEQKKLLEDYGKAADVAFQLLSDIASKRSEKRLSEIDDEISAEEKRIDRLRELADQGNEDADNNLALATQRQAELELEREQQLRRQKKSELALTAIQTYGGKVTAGAPNPLASTISDISVLRAFVNTLPGFFEGTEDTGTKGALRDKHGAITGFTHENERVLKAEQNRLIGSMSNAELTMLAHRENTRSSRPEISGAMVRELQELKQITKERPVYLGADYDAVAESIARKIQKGQKLERVHTKTGGIWGA